jgi:uncharacterized membrane protein YoaK (UPF0700 family)
MWQLMLGLPPPAGRMKGPSDLGRSRLKDGLVSLADVLPTGQPRPIPKAGRREHLVVLLALVSGSVDAIGFVGLGGAFTSVMTGNLVLTGVSVAHGDWELLLRVAAAIVAYVVGCGIAARVARDLRPVPGEPSHGVHWPSAVTRTLLVEFSLLAIFSIAWWVTSSDPGTAAMLAMLAVNAAALGMQSAAVQRFGVTGLSTTYLTGTLTTLVIRVAHREPLGELGLNAQLIAALVAGGAGGAALALYAAPLAPVLPLLSLLAVLAGGRRLHGAQA